MQISTFVPLPALGVAGAPFFAHCNFLSISSGERAHAAPPLIALEGINKQSVAGVISIGTYGSSLHHGRLSQSVTALSIVLERITCVCSATRTPLSSALASFLSVRCVLLSGSPPKPCWTRDTTRWTSAEYTRICWIPCLRCAVFWRADHALEPKRPPLMTMWYAGSVGYLT